MKDQAKLIKKLRLKKGCKYILFIPTGVLDIKEMEHLNITISEMGFQNLVVVTETNKGIKVIEKEK